MWEARARSVAAIAASLYVTTLVAVPLLDRDRDVLRSYPEDYADGPAGLLVRLGYVAVALMALAIAVAIARVRAWSLRLALGLLGSGSLAALFLAAAPQQVNGGFLLAGILGLALAPAAISIGTRDRQSPVFVTLGMITTLAFATIAIGPHEMAGAINRAWDVLFGLWGVTFAVISRRSREGARAPSDPRPARPNGQREAAKDGRSVDPSAPMTSR